MKWLFSTLLIANLGLFIWLFPQQDSASLMASRMQDVGDLRLASEVVETSPHRVPTGDASSSRVDTQDRLAPPPLTAPQEPARLPRVVEAPVPTEAPVVQAPPPVDSEPALIVPVCGGIGEFEKRSQAELVSVRLLAQGAKTEITSDSSNEQAGFWVLIPQQRDRQGAIAIAKRLENAGITDLWRFTSGNLAHAISLGLFRDEARAQARRDKIEDMGFNPIVKPRYREQTRYRVSYRFPSEATASEADWQEISEQYPEIERKEQPCPE
ncbi:MAG: SPOR domain-containing protein [Candidatus Thiodiazotropha sp.]